MKRLVDHYLEASGLTGGFKVGPASRIAAGYCTPVQKGVTVTRATTAAYTVQGGVDVSAVVGINETGYSSTVSIDDACNDNDHPWCGLSAPPGGMSRLQNIHASITS